MPCAAYAYLCVNHDYEAFENEGLRLLVSISSFSCYTKDTFPKKNCSSLLMNSLY